MVRCVHLSGSWKCFVTKVYTFFRVHFVPNVCQERCKLYLDLHLREAYIPAINARHDHCSGANLLSQLRHELVAFFMTSYCWTPLQGSVAPNTKVSNDLVLII